MSGWVESVELKARIIHSQLAAARILAMANDGSNVEKYLEPYYELLSSLYENEFQFARLADSADLVARYKGPAVDIYDPTVSVAISIFTSIRNQVRNVAKSIVGLSADQRVFWPEALDPRLSGVAHGSFIVGIALPSIGESLVQRGQGEFPEMSEQVYTSVKNAIQSIASISKYIDEDGINEKINEKIDDPAIRDTVLVAAQRLSPTLRSGIESVSFYGDDEDEYSANPLTPKSRSILRRELVRPVKIKKYDSFTGVIREIDLDAKRFEIRNVHGVGSIRCVYSPDMQDKMRHALDTTVSVSGNYETIESQDIPRLLLVDKFEIKKYSEHQRILFQNDSIKKLTKD